MLPRHWRLLHRSVACLGHLRCWEHLTTTLLVFAVAPPRLIPAPCSVRWRLQTGVLYRQSDVCVSWAAGLRSCPWGLEPRAPFQLGIHFYKNEPGRAAVCIKTSHFHKNEPGRAAVFIKSGHFYENEPGRAAVCIKTGHFYKNEPGRAAVFL